MKKVISKNVCTVNVHKCITEFNCGLSPIRAWIRRSPRRISPKRKILFEFLWYFCLLHCPSMVTKHLFRVFGWTLGEICQILSKPLKLSILAILAGYEIGAHFTISWVCCPAPQLFAPKFTWIEVKVIGYVCCTKMMQYCDLTCGTNPDLGRVVTPKCEMLVLTDQGCSMKMADTPLIVALFKSPFGVFVRRICGFI